MPQGSHVVKVTKYFESIRSRPDRTIIKDEWIQFVIEFRGSDISETRDLDENTVLDVDADGNVCAITFEHASQRTDVDHLTVEGIAA